MLTPSSSRHNRLIAMLLAFGMAILLCRPTDASIDKEQIRIGVLAYRGKDHAVGMWGETARYLSSKLPQYDVSIVPLDFNEIDPSVSQRRVDFVIANTSIYVELESKYGVSRIATLKNLNEKGYFTVFGGVIFCRNDRIDIQALTDLKGKSFTAVDETSLGGWQAAWRELKAQGVDPSRDFSALTFLHTHDAVVHSVLEGEVDAGTVRTDTLEHMVAEGKIKTNAIRVLDARRVEKFPYALSTRLYPEWPFAKLKDTPDELSEQVVIELLRLGRDDPASRASNSAGWTIPLDYQPVHDLMRELGIGPYKDFGKITPTQVIKRYWIAIGVIIAGILSILAVMVYVMQINRKLSRSENALRQMKDHLEETVKARTTELITTNAELEEEIAHKNSAIAESEKLHEQLLQSQKLEAIGQLAGGVAHDFNNILGAIVGYSHLACMTMAEDDPNRPYMDQILAASDRATLLVQDLLAFGRKQQVHLIQLDLNDIVLKFEKFLSRILREDIELKTHYAPLGLPVLADRIKIEQILMNLVMNARDAMPRGGRIVIETGRLEADQSFAVAYGFEELGMYACLSVTDTGCGIPGEIKDKIFEPFFTTKKEGKGTGLGLSVVYGIVKRHRGHIHVYSQPGIGSTFKVYLPLARSEGPVEAETRPEEIPLRGGAETILIAEDDTPLRELASATLSHYGYTVIEAVDGLDAKAKFLENQDSIDLVVLDGIMPRMNGKEAWREITAIKPGIKAVFISGYAEDIFTKEGIPDQEVAFIQKPAPPATLLRVIREVLDA